MNIMKKIQEMLLPQCAICLNICVVAVFIPQHFMLEPEMPPQFVKWKWVNSSGGNTYSKITTFRTASQTNIPIPLGSMGHQWMCFMRGN